MLLLSHSRLKTWRFCTQAYFYRYEMRLERKQRTPQLLMGSAVHEAIEAVLKVENWQDKVRPHVEYYHSLLPQERGAFGDFPGELIRIVMGYFRHWDGDGLRYRHVELEFEPVVLAEGIGLKGKADAIVEHNGMLWLLERKTARTFPDERNRMMNAQSLLYVYLARANKIPVQGILWDYVRSKPPAIPETLKDGTLTTRKNIDTDYETYLAEVERLGHDPKAYAGILSQLKQTKKDAFYRRVRQPVSDHALKVIVTEAIRDGRRILRYAKKPTRNLNFWCSTCPFQPLCQAELFGYDAGYILRNDYQTREEDSEPKSLESE